MTVLEAALEYREQGWSVFPVVGKQPAVDWGSFKEELPTTDQVRAWFASQSDVGVAVALGALSGIVRIDIEGPGAEAALAAFGGIPETAEFETPAGGRGYILRYMEGLRTEVLWKGTGDHEEVRVQSEGAYTVLPPSPHPKGGKYRWVRKQQPSMVPQWLRDRCSTRILRQLEAEMNPTLRVPERTEVAEALEHIPSDDYDTWIRVGMALKSADMFDLWDAWSRRSSKYKEGECEAKWSSFSSGGLTLRTVFYYAEKYGSWRPVNRHEPLTDLGNARVLARLGTGQVVHSSKWGWLQWDGKRWDREGGAKAVQELQKKALEHRFNMAVASLARHLQGDRSADGHEAKTKRKMRTVASIRKHEEEPRIRGARALAESEPDLSVDYRKFDSQHFLLSCNNAVLNLVTGEVREHRREDWITQLCPTEYFPEAMCPRWEKFLQEVLPDEGTRTFIRMFFGSCLTGDVSCQIMPVLWGTGANGKSTFINTVMHVLGEDYSMKAKRDFLTARRGGEHPTSIARLHGKRFVACVESGEGARLDETLVKELTGGDAIAARRMREDEWEFMPTHKAVLVTNHKPEVRGTDEAIWRRLVLVPFTQQFLDGDPELADKLKLEASGILGWMVAGCREWIANNRRLPRPQAVAEASVAYRAEQDRIMSFIADRCVVGDDKRVRSDKLVAAYASWCAVNKHPQLNSNAFSRALNERGFLLESQGSKWRRGLDLAE